MERNVHYTPSADPLRIFRTSACVLADALVTLVEVGGNLQRGLPLAKKQQRLLGLFDGAGDGPCFRRAVRF